MKMPLSVEPVEHIPGAGVATTCFVIYADTARVWLDLGDRAVIVADVDLSFQTGGPGSVARILDELGRAVGDLVDEYNEHVAPVVRRCLPYWGRP